MSDGPTVLLVDDEPSILRGLSGLLRGRGYTVRTALSGTDAIRVAATERIDAAVIDYRIPDWRGDVVWALLTTYQPHLRTRTVFITGDIQDGVQRVAEAMACPLLLKPFDVEELEYHLRRLLQSGPGREHEAEEEAS
jgi:CheY-like chemotaxis protein